jgi:hypothetical protein
VLSPPRSPPPPNPGPGGCRPGAPPPAWRAPGLPPGPAAGGAAARRPAGRPGRSRDPRGGTPSRERVVPGAHGSGVAWRRGVSPASRPAGPPDPREARRGLPCRGARGARCPPCPGPRRRDASPRPLAGRVAGRSRPAPAPAAPRSWDPHRARGRGDAPRARPGLGAPGPPSRAWGTAPGGAPPVPRAPGAARPRAPPPGVSGARALPHPGRRPSGAGTPWAGAARPRRLSRGPRLARVRGSRTRPASALPPASYAHGWAGTWRALLTGWRGVRQVGRAPEDSHPLGHTNHLHRIAPPPKVSGLPWREQTLVRRRT